MGDSPRYLVVNADDLGLHQDINRGIRSAHTEGIVTSTSIVASGSAFEDACRVLEDCPALDVGVHLTLIEERPVLDPGVVPSLVTSDRVFPSSYRALSERVFRRAVNRDDVARELRAQIERVLEAGIVPSHVDSHQHVHVLEPIRQVAIDLAEEYRIPFIRVPSFESPLSSWRRLPDPVFRIGLNYLSGRTRRQVRRLRHADRTALLHRSGHITADSLLMVIDALSPGVTEIVAHPGITTPDLSETYRWAFDWSGEVDALTSSAVRERTAPGDIHLVGFRDLIARSA